MGLGRNYHSTGISGASRLRDSLGTPLHMKYIQFADDTTLHVSHSNKHYLKFWIESDMNVLFDWFNANKLTLNLNKSVSCCFSLPAKRM